MKRIIIILTAVTLLLSVCVGCENSTDKPVLSPEEIYERIIEEVDLPIMLDISESRLDEYNVEPDNAVSFIAKEAAISAIFVQLIIIEAKDGKVGAVRDAMSEHQARLKDDAFYPQGRQAAAASIVGTIGNLVYLICDENAQEVEKIIKES